MGVPDHVRLTGQVLFFRGFFNEAVTESADETFRRRMVLLRYFLEDDTFELFESRRRNDGMDGSKFLSRQQHDAVTLDSLRVGSTVRLYSRVFKITACDEFTRSFYEERGQPQHADEGVPTDPFGETSASILAATSGWSGKRTNAISRYVEAVRGKAVAKKDTLGRFLRHGMDSIIFFGLWDETAEKHDMFATKQHLAIRVFLTDDTVEIFRMRLPGEAKTMDPNCFLKRARLPKVPIVHDDRERSCEDGTGDEDYFTTADFVVGETMAIHGKRVLLYDCTQDAQHWSLANTGVDQKARTVDVSEPVKPKPTLPVPPHHGFGSEADTLHSIKYLDPQSHPRKGNYKRFLESKGKTLKFFAHLDTEDPVDSLRRYRITWYLDDDTLAVYEQEVRNTGIAGGKWQARTTMTNPDTGKAFVSGDFYVDARVTIKGHRFVVFEADEFSYRFMEDSTSLWPMSSIDFVLSKLKGKLREKSGSLRKMFRKFDEDKSQTISLDEFQRMLDYFGMALSKQECVTIFRAFDADGEGFIEYSEFMEAFTDKDEDGGAAAASASAHVDSMATGLSEADAARYFAVVEEREASAKKRAAADVLLGRIARSMKQSKSAAGMHENFRKFDKNKDHTIDKTEFAEALGNSGFYLGAEDISVLEHRFFPPGVEEMDYESFMGVLHEYADKSMLRSG